MYVSTLHVCTALGGQKQVWDIGIGVTDSCHPACRCRELIPCLLEEHPMLLTAEWTISPTLKLIFFLKICLHLFILCVHTHVCVCACSTGWVRTSEGVPHLYVSIAPHTRFHALCHICEGLTSQALVPIKTPSHWGHEKRPFITGTEQGTHRTIAIKAGFFMEEVASQQERVESPWGLGFLSSDKPGDLQRKENERMQHWKSIPPHPWLLLACPLGWPSRLGGTEPSRLLAGPLRRSKTSALPVCRSWRALPASRLCLLVGMKKEPSPSKWWKASWFTNSDPFRAVLPSLWPVHMTWQGLCG